MKRHEAFIEVLCAVITSTDQDGYENYSDFARHCDRVATEIFDNVITFDFDDDCAGRN